MPTAQLLATRKTPGKKKESTNLSIAKKKGKGLQKNQDKIPNRMTQDQSLIKNGPLLRMMKSRIKGSEDSSIVIWNDQPTKVFLDLRQSSSLWRRRRKN